MNETIGSTAPCPVFVISLPEAVERRAGIKKQLDALGIAFEFVDAVRGSALTKEQRAQMVGPESEMVKHIDRVLTDGEIGCALSHQRVYDRVIQERFESAFVLEDDALLLPGFLDALCAAAALPDMDLLIFGYPKLSQEDVECVGLYDPVMPLGKLGDKHYYGIRPRESHLGMVGYLISFRGCKKMKINSPLITVADDHLLFSKIANIWHLRPFAVMEDTVHVSTIRGDFRRNRFGLSVRQRISRSMRGFWRHGLVFLMRLGVKAKKKEML